MNSDDGLNSGKQELQLRVTGDVGKFRAVEGLSQGHTASGGTEAGPRA